MKNSLILLERTEQTDPRIEIDPGSLALAKRNAFPVVAQRTAPNRGSGGLAAGVAGAVLLGGLTFWSMSGSRTAEISKPVAAAASSKLAGPAPLALPPEAMTQVPAAAPGVAMDPMAGPMPMGDPAAVTHVMPPAMGTQASPTLIVDSSGPTEIASASGAAGGDANGAFGGPIGAGGSEVATATRMANPGQTVAQGTLIAAVLETAINSDLPGYVRAVVSSDVRSFDGSRVLVPRSSRLIGQYKSGIASGQTRTYVTWTRLIRPDGVSVALASPAVDEIGQTGLTGKVDGHFMKRFGSALLLSVVGSASTLASGGAALVVSGGETAASAAAQRDGQIPPTIKVRQGQPIRVFTARDLDFSTAAGRAR